MISWVGHCPLPTSLAGPFVLSFDLGGDRAKGGERGFVFPIGSFTFRRPGGHAAFGPSSSAPPPLRSCFIWAIALVMALAMAPGGLQISSPNQFGDHFAGSYPEGGLNDLVHGVKVQVTGRLRRCRAIKRRSSAPQRAASLTLV